ncbi:murein biosynthesis integral membrane protein MurJ, partial [Klebsiella pneumoniae]|nr:murein biosynthesis integral membrane protein MurJ [Klebsiella pneumoniae]
RQHGAHGFLVALFLPEAVRTMLAGGVLSSAALALWQARTVGQRPGWLGATTLGLGGLGVVLALACMVGAGPLTHLVGPGLP